MTFEEFFAKKKIDLVQLEKAEPSLFSEFKSHFNLMGEKSFDHTKKFWFNKLRRLYHLSTPEKAITQMETKIASQAKTLSSPTIDQITQITSAETTTGSEAPPATNKPRFTPRNIPAKKAAETEAKLPEVAESQNKEVKKPGFKPRNIPSPASEHASDADNPESRPGQYSASDTPITNPGAVEEAEKQGNKPRFKMRNVPRNPGGAEEQTGHTTEEKIVGEPGAVKPDTEKSSVEAAPPVDETPAKPAYKPRFNMKNVPKPAPDQGEEEKGAGKESQDSETPKPAYKPRFNMKNLPGKKEEKSAEEQKSQELSAENPAEEEPNAATKPAYKPRFNMKNLPKQAEQERPVEQEKEAAKDPEQTDQAAQNPESQPKPAYKPRFNMKNIKPKSEE
ncbi:hypothetical protein [Pedobacter sp. SYSU D00535]|uniref:hypothetical protein n=1 Tax=Pedobacter sp. SYSU D00535 TaxID=2810308 RepID=UPI001A95A31C|nr:hypothetical protein [Pedobacter sp. SYSU D00535]